MIGGSNFRVMKSRDRSAPGRDWSRDYGDWTNQISAFVILNMGLFEKKKNKPPTH